jgi:shikimate dehydrogenase
VVPDQSYHVVINATSASLAGDLPPMKSAWFDAQTLAYDMMYAAQPTVFMQAATHHGAGMVQDGLGMLIEQAAEAFFLWRGIRPQTDAVRAQW